MEELLKEELKTKRLESLGSSGGGCISEAQSFHTDHGNIFVKINKRPDAKVMFEGEYRSLLEIGKTNTIKVPRPIKVIDLPAGGSMFVMEHLDISPLSKYSAEFGRQLASLHLHNSTLGSIEKKKESYVGQAEDMKYVDQFGFDVSTCCGYLPQSNSWQFDWLKFFCSKMDDQMLVAERKYNDKEVRELWNTLLPNVYKLFTGLEIKPALLHGDLWSGNAAEIKDGPVIYDPASFYGHSEYDLAIATIYGGYSDEYFQGYHKVIPKAKGLSQRLKLYQLFHFLNHWNHFDEGYRTRYVETLKLLVSATK